MYLKVIDWLSTETGLVGGYCSCCRVAEEEDIGESSGACRAHGNYDNENGMNRSAFKLVAAMTG